MGQLKLDNHHNDQNHVISHSLDVDGSINSNHNVIATAPNTITTASVPMCSPLSMPVLLEKKALSDERVSGNNNISEKEIINDGGFELNETQKLQQQLQRKDLKIIELEKLVNEMRQSSKSRNMLQPDDPKIDQDDKNSFVSVNRQRLIEFYR